MGKILRFLAFVALVATLLFKNNENENRDPEYDES
jgi:hypothetical protein